jgi:ankyrin repeat protein
MPEYILPTIFQAIENNDEALLKRLLDKRPVLAMKRDVSGTTALMLAARLGRTACLRVLVPLSDPLAVAKQGYSALVIAAQRMWPAVDCVEALLPLSSPLETDSNGGTALIWQRRRGT